MRKSLEKKKWISCGVNLDEDIHFSTLYLRMSLDKNIGHIFPGYSSFVAIYENFNEEYFLEEKECLELAKKLTHKIMIEPSWFEQILNNVIRKTDTLCKIFDEQKIARVYLKKQDNNTIKKLYKMQLDASWELYEYARIPEILDRGVNYYTNYLMEYLKKKLNKNDVYEEFLLLTATKEKTIFQEADEDLQNIIRMIPEDLLMNATIRSLRLKLPFGVRREINAYLEKWRYLDYHGYGMKRILSFEDILLKIINKDYNVLRSNEDELEKKIHLVKEKDIPKDIINLFDIYPKLAITKLYRKYYQIRNFYFLDMILSEIADRMQESEEFIRSMLPEEILEYLENGTLIKEQIESRINECAYIYCDSKEFIVTDRKEISLIKNKVQEKCENKRLNELSGYPVSKGFITGRSVIINRRQDMVKFQDGDIILSDSADPDIFDIIKHAGAVLTVQGGATSHAALFCREQGIPAIIGIKELLRIPNGTQLEVDAFSGTVKILYNNREDEEQYNIGQKAKNLMILRDNNFRVPEFSILNYFEIKAELECSEIEKITQKLYMCGLELVADRKYIFRSSAINEDTIDESNVGRYSSIANVDKSELLDGLKKFINENKVKDYSGSIIFQEMLPFEFCGVTITGDSRLNMHNFVTIEVCKGSHNSVTEGLGNMVRIIYDKGKDEIKEVLNVTDKDFIVDLHINDLINKFLKIEKIWNKPVDIEWGIYKDRLYILQARPIVMS